VTFSDGHYGLKRLVKSIPLLPPTGIPACLADSAHDMRHSAACE
jgi:hypothetical protein